MAHETTGVVIVPGGGPGGSALFLTGSQAIAALQAGTGVLQPKRHVDARGRKAPAGPRTTLPTTTTRSKTVILIERPTEQRGRRTNAQPPAAFLTAAAPEPPTERRDFVHKRIGKFVKRNARKIARATVGAIPIVGGAVAQFIPQAPAIPQIPDLLRLPRRSGPAAPEIQFVGGPGAPPQPPSSAVSTGAEFQAVQGAFGLPAMAPMAMQRIHLDCPRGMVLGRDNLCYPKQVLRRNSKFRKWRSGPRPPISAADAKMIRRLAAARAAVIKLAEGVDLVTKKKVNPK